MFFNISPQTGTSLSIQILKSLQTDVIFWLIIIYFLDKLLYLIKNGNCVKKQKNKLNIKLDDFRKKL